MMLYKAILAVRKPKRSSVLFGFRTPELIFKMKYCRLLQELNERQSQYIFRICFSAAVGCEGTTTLLAKLNTDGVSGTITFTQQNLNDNVTINLDLDGVSSGSYTLELHEYRVSFDTANVCSSESIGER